MAKIVSVKRAMVPTAQQRQDQTTQAAASSAVTLVGVVLTALLLCGAVAMVLMAFNAKPS